MPEQARKDLKEVGWTKRRKLAKVARRDGQHFDCATLRDVAVVGAHSIDQKVIQ